MKKFFLERKEYKIRKGWLSSDTRLRFPESLVNSLVPSLKCLVGLLPKSPFTL